MANNFLWDLVKVSLATSLVIAALLLLTPLLQKRYRARWRCWVWLVIAARLLIPMGIPFPDIPIALPLPQQVAQQAPVPQQSDTDPVMSSEGLAEAPAPIPAAQAPKPRTETAGEIALTIWAAGAALYVAVQAAAYFRFLRRLRFCPRTALPAQVSDTFQLIAADLGIHRIPQLLVSAGAPTPLLAGLPRPRLYLPHLRYTGPELVYVLRHELVHYRHRDLWCKLLLAAASALHWFNPLVHAMAEQAGKDLECACDDAVMAGLCDGERHAYAQTILNALPIRRKWGIAPVMTTTLGSGKKTVMLRLRNLFDRSCKKRGIAALCSVALAAGFVGGGISFTAVAAAEPTRTIERTVSGDGVENIEISAITCQLVLEPHSSNQFTATFAYPALMAPNYEKYFDLTVEKPTADTVRIRTEYDDHGFDNLPGEDQLTTAPRLIVKVPDRQYVTLSLRLIVNEDSYGGEGRDTLLPLDIRARELRINSTANLLKIPVSQGYDNIHLKNNAGNLELSMPTLSGDITCENSVGAVKLLFEQEPSDFALTMSQQRESSLNLPESWQASAVRDSGGQVTLRRGAGSNTIRVENDLGDLTLGFQGAQLHNVPAREGQSAGKRFEDTDGGERLMEAVRNIPADRDYFYCGRIDVVDDEGYDHQASVYVVQGSASYRAVFEQGLADLKAAYAGKTSPIAAYTEAYNNGSKTYSHMDKEFAGLDTISFQDSAGRTRTLCIVAGDGSERFLRAMKTVESEIFDHYVSK